MYVCVCMCICACVQVIASKYLNDEGEMEALTNSEWSAIGVYVCARICACACVYMCVFIYVTCCRLYSENKSG